MKGHRRFTTRTVFLLVLITLLTSPILPLLTARGQAQDEPPQADKVRGQILKSYRESEKPEKKKGKKKKPARPDWVEAARQRATGHLNERKEEIGLEDAEAELELLGVDEDDLGQTHVRMDQTHNGVKVFGGQLIAHLDSQSMLSVSGRFFKEARIDTTPTFTAEQAIAAAKIALGHNGEFASEPTAELLLLPHQIFKEDDASSATLVYQVSLQIADGEAGPAHNQYFVDARDGSIVWHYNSLASATGHGLYSGTVGIASTYIGNSNYQLSDPNRGGSNVTDMNDQNRLDRATAFVDSDNVWGDGTLANRQTVAVDAANWVAKAWDYFLYAHGRRGLDNAPANVQPRGINIYVHYRKNPPSPENNAYGSKDGLYFGTGDVGTTITPTWRPAVSLDVVGHEYTHAMIDYIFPGSGMIYAQESGAIEESFADIFGTMMEWYYNINGTFNGITIRPDYLLTEDVTTNGQGIRDMQNPSAFSHPDHYANRVFPGTCTPSDSNDQCGVHTNSSIMNHAFFLLAEGGRHRLSGMAVPRIGRWEAAQIFYRALTTYLTPSARFTDVYAATVRAAADLYNPASFQVWAVTRAWQAVGVAVLHPSVGYIEPGYYVIRAKHSRKVLSVHYYSYDNGGEVKQWDYAGYDNQKWLIQAAGDGYFRVAAKHSGKVLSVYQYSLAAGGIVNQWDDAGYENQRWLIQPTGNGDYTIFARHSHLALSVDGYSFSNEQSIINQWWFAGYDNQKWILERVN